MPASNSDIGGRTARNSAGLVIRTVVGQVTGLLTLLLLSTRLEPASFAVYAMAILIVTAATSMVTLPVIMVLVRTEASPPRVVVNSATTFGGAFLVGMGLLALGVVAAAEPSYVAVAAAGILYAICTAATIPSTVVLQRDLQAARASIINLVVQLVIQASMVGCLLAGASLESSLVVALAASAVLSVLCAQILAPWRLVPERISHVRPLLSSASGAFVIGLVALAVTGGITVATSAIASQTEAGYFAWAYSITLAAQGLVAVFDTALIPALARVAAEARESAYAMATRLATFFSIVVNIVIALVIPSLVGNLFPSHWSHAIPALTFLCIGNMFAGYGLTAHSLLYVQSSTTSLARRYVIACLLATVSLVILLPLFGATGGGLAFLVFQSTLAALLHLGVRTVAAPQLMPLFWIVAAGMVLGVRALLAAHDLGSDVLTGAIALVAFLALAVAIDRGRIVAEVRILIGHLLRSSNRDAAAGL